MTRRFRILPAALLLLLLAPVAARAGWWDDLDKGQSVRLADVFAQPERFGDRPITFVCVLMGRDEVFFPLHTPFSEQRYDNIAVWEDGTPVWDETAFKEKVRPFFYIDQHHPQRDDLMRLERMTRIEVTARIRAVHRGTPFLEILSWRKTGYRLGERVVRDVIGGDDKARMGEYDLAAESYRRALVFDLAPTYALQIRKRLADVLRRAGHDAEADAVLGGADIHTTSPTPAPPEPGMPGAPVATGTPIPVAPSGRPLPTDLPPTALPPTGLPPTGPTARTSDLPGQPVDAVPPTGPLAPAPAPSLMTGASDLPGTPVDAGPQPLPAVPGAVPPGSALAPPGSAPAGSPPAGSAQGTPPAGTPPQKPPPPPPADSGSKQAPNTPPKRNPRLEGVR